jgi:hypothetical protein
VTLVVLDPVIVCDIDILDVGEGVPLLEGVPVLVAVILLDPVIV